jgi:hypothetical protein
VLKNGVGRYDIFNFYTKLAESSFLCHFRIESVNVFVLPRFDLCHVLSSSTNNFEHAQTLSRMSSLLGCMNIARVNIGFFTGFKKIKQQRISFVLGYLRMILWKISTAISIKHRILATFNIKKKINSDSLYAFNTELVFKFYDKKSTFFLTKKKTEGNKQTYM